MRDPLSLPGLKAGVSRGAPHDDELDRLRAELVEAHDRAKSLAKLNDAVLDSLRDELTNALNAVDDLIAANEAAETRLREELAEARAHNLRLAISARVAERRMMWQPIAIAPKDREIAVYAVELGDVPDENARLDPIVSRCRWHEDAGFCVCEVRVATHWCELPK